MVAIHSILDRALESARAGAYEKDKTLLLKSTGPDAHTKKILRETSQHSKVPGVGLISPRVVTEVTFGDLHMRKKVSRGAFAGSHEPRHEVEGGLGGPLAQS